MVLRQTSWLAAIAVALAGCATAASTGAGDVPSTSEVPTAPTEAPPTESVAPPSASPSPAASVEADDEPAAEATEPAVTVVRVRVERRTTDDATAGFVDDVLAVLGDARGWRRAGFRFEADDDAPHLVVLAEGDEVDRLCLPYDTHGRYSCQNGPVVALNADRWRVATPQWTGSLADYRVMLVNHEVGHLLHLHHPRPQCPGQGWPAPVMMQQSTELGACTANPWPLPWEVELAARQLEPLAPPADHDVDDHRPTPPRERQEPAAGA